jgi:hypothetical protein
VSPRIEETLDLMRRQTIRCVETLRGPMAELFAADIPPVIIAGVLVELLIETAHYNQHDAPEILSAALDNLRTAGTN